ncbi:MAG: hypothetical protein GY832_37855 [Chloroflexi bacterium]|nr:hypothetical protein [Chloroflexota bacterium]
MVNKCEKRIVTCTTSAWLTGIVDSLQATPDLTVLQILPQEMSAVQVNALSPDAVIMECGIGRTKVIDAISSNTPVIEIDAARSELTIRVTNKVSATSVADLVRVIEKVTKQEIE